VGVLEEPTSDMALRSALSSLIALGLEGPHLSRLVAHCSGVRALLTICLESRSSSIRTAALRALATVCCVVEAIRQLEQVPLQCSEILQLRLEKELNISWWGESLVQDAVFGSLNITVCRFELD
jgi:hypothetical protein